MADFCHSVLTTSSQRDLAEYTLQRRLSNIFEKVGVRSRRALLKQLVFDNLLPGLKS